MLMLLRSPNYYHYPTTAATWTPVRQISGKFADQVVTSLTHTTNEASAKLHLPTNLAGLSSFSCRIIGVIYVSAYVCLFFI